MNKEIDFQKELKQNLLERVSRKQYKKIKNKIKRKIKRRDIARNRENIIEEVKVDEEEEKQYQLSKKRWEEKEEQYKLENEKKKQKENKLKKELEDMLGRPSKLAKIDYNKHPKVDIRNNINIKKELYNGFNNQDVIDYEYVELMKKQHNSIKQDKNCLEYDKIGLCSLGDQCDFIHRDIDESKVILVPGIFQAYCKIKDNGVDKDGLDLKKIHFYHTFIKEYTHVFDDPNLQNFKVSYHMNNYLNGNVYLEYKTKDGAKKVMESIKRMKLNGNGLSPKYIKNENIIDNQSVQCNKQKCTNNCNNLHFF